MQALRIGLVGAGDMGQVHADAWSAVAGVEIACVVARTETRASTLAARFGARVATDVESLLDDPSIDAVDLTLPTALHRDLAIAALQCGKHVFCETPLAPCVTDAEAMLRAAEASGRLLQVALLMRVVEPGGAIRQALRRGELGRIDSVRTERLWPGLRATPASVPDHHGDALEELALFDFDYLVWCFGMPRSLTATGVGGANGHDLDHVWVALDFAPTVALVEASRVLPEGFPFTIGGRVLGKRGAVEWSVVFAGPPPPTVRVARYLVGRTPEISAPLGPNPYEVECRHFAAVLRGEADPGLLAAERALDGLRMVEAARRSILEARPVRL